MIRDSSPQETVLAWLQAELASERFKNDLLQSLLKFETTESIITKANLDDTIENSLRYKVLKDYRDWFDDNVNEYRWSLVELDADDVGKLEYIDYSYWNELSDKTRKVEIAAKNIQNGKVVFQVPNDRFWSVAKAIETGEEFSPIVILKDSPDSSSRIVEGHLRATSYLLAKVAPKPLLATLGVARS